MLEAMRPINRSKAGIANPRGVFDPIAAFDTYLRGGLEALSPEARAVLDYQKFNAAMGTTTGRDGGFTGAGRVLSPIDFGRESLRRHACRLRISSTRRAAIRLRSRPTTTPAMSARSCMKIHKSLKCRSSSALWRSAPSRTPRAWFACHRS